LKTKKIFDLIDSKAKSGLFIMVLLILLVFWSLNLDIKKISLQIIIGELFSILSIKLIKKIVKKKRKIKTKHSKDYAFPSSHTSSIFLLAIIMCYWTPLLGFFILPFAFFIAYSRIKLGVHDLIDVVGGAIYGILVGICMLRIF